MEECYFKFVFPYWKFVLRHILVLKVDTFLLNQKTYLKTTLSYQILPAVKSTLSIDNPLLPGVH